MPAYINAVIGPLTSSEQVFRNTMLEATQYHQVNDVASSDEAKRTFKESLRPIRATPPATSTNRTPDSRQV